MNIGQYNEFEMNHDLDHELDPKIAEEMTVEEEFKERVRK